MMVLSIWVVIFPLHVIYGLLFVKKRDIGVHASVFDQKHALHQEPKKVSRLYTRDLAEKSSTMHVNRSLSAREQQNK